MSRVDLDEVFNMPTDKIRKFIADLLDTKVYFKARPIARKLLEDLYGIGHMILRYEQIAWNWTKKVANILKGYAAAGILEVYNKSNKCTLYKKVLGKKERSRPYDEC